MTVSGPSTSPSSIQPSRQRQVGRRKAVLLEALLVSVGAAALGLLANQVSPRGLALGRDYFPSDRLVAGPAVSGTNMPMATGPERAAARIRQLGLQVIDRAEAIRLFDDPRRQAGLIVFVDARDDAHYQAGHVPGAFQFDHYRPERYLPELLPACLVAEQIVVYCTGGDCEDSEFAAVALSRAGVPMQRLAIYLGGFTDWSTNRLPVELGPRNSGQLRTSGP